jgi:ankyrin repeat protein
VVTCNSQNGLTPLILAAQNESGRAVQALLKAGVDVNAVDKVRGMSWNERVCVRCKER